MVGKPLKQNSVTNRIPHAGTNNGVSGTGPNKPMMSGLRQGLSHANIPKIPK